MLKINTPIDLFDYIDAYTRKLHCHCYLMLIAVTRIHCQAASSLVDVSRVIDFARSCPWADKVLICVGTKHAASLYKTNAELSNALRNERPHENVTVQAICPWGGFTTALNIALNIALNDGMDHILFQSLEVRASTADIKALLRHMDSNTLVAGAALDGHEFILGEQPLRGRTCPWNTLAVWALRKLGLVGFPLIGDGISSEVAGGVEEVTAVAIARLLNPSWTAKLIRLNGSHSLSWTTTFSDEERRVYHENKMASKDTRSSAQLKELGSVSAGMVVHVDEDVN